MATMPKSLEALENAPVTAAAAAELPKKMVMARALLAGRGPTRPDDARAPDRPPHYRCAEEVVTQLRPTEPVFCFRPAELRRLAAGFVTAFPGRVLYAMKCNPHPIVLGTLYEAGVRDFDVASLAEIALVGQLFGETAEMFFNNPAKSRPAIRAAIRSHGVRHYVVDHRSELDKLVEEAGSAGPVVSVRLSTASNRARYNLSTKFGAPAETAVDLLRQAHRQGLRTGLAFHVGSQCLASESFTAALALCGEVSRAAGVRVSLINVGGGFPAPYPGDRTAPLERYFAAITEGYRALGLPECELLCEPGRALVATAASVLVQVVVRKEQRLYISDGIFGGLNELRHPQEMRPAGLVRPGRPQSSELCPFKVFGPTCDSDDALAAPLLLPADTEEGDWVEIGMMGAYSSAMTTRFNGFSCSTFVTLDL